MSDLVKDLNGDLELEYAAAVQYVQHAATIGGVLSAFAGELKTHADEEFGHAKKLADHINYLGGIPSVKIGDVYSASDARAILVQDLNGEKEAIGRYKERVEQCRKAGDFGTLAVLLEILADEEHHANDLTTWLED